ncbi:MAG: patatin-like phospholipase family protein [Alcaligenaceae bacterium]|nr:patatin-like phospholipase family protein [Alcaligenaceae bacterium]
MRLKYLKFVLMACALQACASVNSTAHVLSFKNQPLAKNKKNTPIEATHQNDPSLLWITAVSGGGTRSASFAYGVLEALSKETYTWRGHQQTLLDQTDFIRGVSGGSVIATSYALNGPKIFKGFKENFLYEDFQGNIFTKFFNPALWNGLNKGKYGRAHVMAQAFDHLYKNKTYGDLRKNSYAHLTVLSTDVTSNAPFAFSANQFNLICSDLDQVPLSVAVSASAAVPLFFNPIPLTNYATQCDVSNRLFKKYRSLPLYGNKNKRLRSEKMYYASTDKQYIHLVDGGVSDNLGVHGLMNPVDIKTGDTPFASGRHIKDIVLLAINAMSWDGHDVDQKSEVLANEDVGYVLTSNFVNKVTYQTIRDLKGVKTYWPYYWRQLPYHLRNRISPDVRVHVIVLNLSDFAKDNPKLNRQALNVKTSFTLPKEDVDLMIRAGKEVLLQNLDYQALRRRLRIK